MDIELKYICHILIITVCICWLPNSYASEKECQRQSASLRLANAFMSEELEEGMNGIMLEGYEVELIEHCGHEPFNALVPKGMAYAFDKKKGCRRYSIITQRFLVKNMASMFQLKAL